MAETEPIPSQESGEEQESEIKPVEDLTELKAEIAQLKEEKPNSRAAILLINVNPDHLTNEDVEFYNAFALDEWDKKEYYDYQDRIDRAQNGSDNPALKSRADFSSFLLKGLERKIPKNP